MGTLLTLSRSLFSLSLSLFLFPLLMTFPEAYDRIHPFYRHYAIERAKDPPPATFEEGRNMQKQQYRAERENVPQVVCNSHTLSMDDDDDSKSFQVYVIRPPGTETTLLPVMVFMYVKMNYLLKKRPVSNPGVL